MRIEVGIGFGSNMGDRLANLAEARKLLLQSCADSTKAIFSPVFETPPIDCAPGTTPFYNAVGEFTFSTTPESILELCLRIEQTMGRDNIHEVNTPRPIDLDLLYAGGFVKTTPELTVPHPRLTSRLFVLAPLATIRPNLKLPGDNSSIMDHLNRLTHNKQQFPIVSRNW